MSWHDGPMMAFDTETTGTDPHEARIVTACVVRVRSGHEPLHRSWIANPGIPIPAEATAVHGVTDERACAEGGDPAEVADAIADELVSAWSAAIPVIAMNFPYDGTVLACELRRHGLASLAERLGTAQMLVVDPLVLDRALDRFRRGKKRLSDLCEVYGVGLDDAHDASADALAAARVVWRMAMRFPEALQGELSVLQDQQVLWHAQWAEEFEGWMRQNVDPRTVIARDWPLGAMYRPA